MGKRDQRRIVAGRAMAQTPPRLSARSDITGSLPAARPAYAASKALGVTTTPRLACGAPRGDQPRAGADLRQRLAPGFQAAFGAGVAGRVERGDCERRGIEHRPCRRHPGALWLRGAHEDDARQGVVAGLQRGEPLAPFRPQRVQMRSPGERA